MTAVAMPRRREPAQTPATSKQDYGTPQEFIDAVTERFGPLDFDLAARGVSNAKAPMFFTPKMNALAQDWSQLTGNLWLNPPFRKISPWATKCAATCPRHSLAERRILLLTPASVGSQWFIDSVHKRAAIFALSPRLKFVGADDDYPKDCILSVFGVWPGFDVWRWRS